jgi:hypothetical protein
MNQESLVKYGPQGMTKIKKFRFFGFTLIFVSGITLFILYLFRDPTVPWQESQVRLKRLVREAVPEDKFIVEERMEPFYPDRIPRRTTFRYRGAGAVTGLPDRSHSLLFELQGGRIRCYSHYFQGRTSSFSVLYSHGCLPAAQQFTKALIKEFRGLPVTLEESESLKLKDPTR